MLYENTATASNGNEVHRFIRAESDEQAIEKFNLDWSEYGDPKLTEPVITQRWTEAV